MLSSPSPFPVVISAPSGTGKTTLVQQLVTTHPEVFYVSVSATTRPLRGGEIDGIHYHFVTRDAFTRLIGDGLLLEWACVYDQFYGTPRAEIQRGTEGGRITLLDIDVQGGMQVMSSVPGSVAVFLLPPSLQDLASRLRTRGTDDEHAVATRLREATREIEQGMAAYDYLVINDKIDKCVDTVWSIIDAERSRAWRLNAVRRSSEGA
ncbi:guanylate kinase [Candidatus Fermentibacteria bacterium]|nr:guanylate kinase [Candidatus Fermentibacteria bacterium]